MFETIFVKCAMAAVFSFTTDDCVIAYTVCVLPFDNTPVLYAGRA